MTRKKPTAVERLAERYEAGESFTKVVPDDFGQATVVIDYEAIARHVLKRERAARGTTVGHTAVTTEKAPRLCCNDLHSEASARSYCEPGGFRLARVVLVPRRRKK